MSLDGATARRLVEGYGMPSCPRNGRARPRLSPAPARCPPWPAEGSSTLPCTIKQPGGRGGAGRPGRPARISRVGRDCIVAREAGARLGRTSGTASCSSTPGRQELGLARVRGARVAGSWDTALGHAGTWEKPRVCRADSPDRAKALRHQSKP